MSGHTLAVAQLVGRRVRNAEGRSIGRIEELLCEIELREGGADYVVREFHVGTFGRLDALAGTVLTRDLLRTFGRAAGYRQHRVPWEAMDLSDPARPRTTNGDWAEKPAQAKTADADRRERADQI
jgi:hypothetical protein